VASNEIQLSDYNQGMERGVGLMILGLFNDSHSTADVIQRRMACYCIIKSSE